MLDKIGFREQVEKCDSLPISLSNNSHKKEVLLESFIISIWCGANRFLHTEVTRSDKALGEIFGWLKTPAHTKYKSISCSPFFSWFFNNLNINYFTLDIDSTVIIRYGEQEGASQIFVLEPNQAIMKVNYIDSFYQEGEFNSLTQQMINFIFSKNKKSKYICLTTLTSL